MLRSSSSLGGRSFHSFIASPRLILPSVTRRFLHRSSTRPIDAHSLRPCPYQSLRQPTLSDAQRKTIYALSTPPGKGGIAVIRVSGPDTRSVWKALTRPLRASLVDKAPTPRLAELRHIIDPLTGEKLDDGLVLFFKGEFHLRVRMHLFIPTHRSKILHYGGCHRITDPLRQSGALFGSMCTIEVAILSPRSTRRVHSARFRGWTIGSDSGRGLERSHRC